MDLGFFAADTLGVTLFQTTGRLVASEIHQIQLGPWRLELPVEVESDILAAKELGFWMTLGEALQLYVVVREKENWLFVLDEDELSVCEQKTRFEALSVKGRILEFKPAIKGVFHWKDDRWTRITFDGAPMGE